MELYYQIALKSVPFDNSYKNVLRFDNRSEQEAYFETNTLFSNSPRVNFNVGSFYATNVIYDCAENESISELLNKNYCIIKDNNPNRTLNYYYYFITNAMQDCDNRIKLSLELDIFQTYYIDLLFGDGVVYKAHLNRFVDNGDGTISFDGRPTSKLFEREEITNVAKRLTKRTKLKSYNTGNQEIDNWLEENIICWLYIYLDANHAYNYVLSNSISTRQFDQSLYSIFNGYSGGAILNAIPSQIVCCCVPIMRTENRLGFKEFSSQSSIIEYPSLRGLNLFLDKNNSFSYVYSMKISSTNPFEKFKGNVTHYEIQSNGNLIIDYPNRIGEIIRTSTDSEYPFAESIIYCSEIPSEIKTRYLTDKEFTFEKSDLINSNKHFKFNPKLLGGDYFDLRISDQTENGFNYDIQKLNKKEFQIKSIESLTPDFSKKLITIDTNNNGLYIKECQEALIGFVVNDETSLMLSTEAYKNMLANNKNFFVQNAVNRELDRAQRNVNTTMGILGDMFNPNVPKRLTSMVTESLDINLDYTRSVIQEKLTVDNLQNAPSIIQGAKGNIQFELMYSEFGIIVEEWDILENEKEMINDFMCLYGFTYNRVDNVKNVDNIRKIYNYVRADIETISGMAISETVHKKFRQCFANGVRFWNTDTFNYDKENYERWLENE